MDEQKVVNGNPSLCRFIKLVCKILEVSLHVQDEFHKVFPSSHVCAENIQGLVKDLEELILPMAEWGPREELMEGRPCRVHNQEGIECVKKVNSWMKIAAGCGRCKGKVRINSMKAHLYIHP